MPDGSHSMEHQENKEESMKGFVEQNTYEAGEGEHHSCCVDGREKGDHAPGARPGADAGDFLTALATLRRLGVDVESIRPAIFEAAIRAVGGAEHFRFHTDAHATHDLHDEPKEKSVARGCGHLRQAEKDPDAYGVTPEDMQALFERLLKLRDEEGVKETVLEGEHGEQAVVVVESERVGLRHNDGATQAFVYHAAFDRARLEALADELMRLPMFADTDPDFKKSLLEALVDMSGYQREATLARLAKGRPIYVLKESGELEPAGQVPD